MVRTIGSTKISPLILILKSFTWKTNQICCNYNKELFQKEIMFCFRNSKGNRKYKIYWPGSLDLSRFWNLVYDYGFWLWLFTLPIAWKLMTLDFSKVYSFSRPKIIQLFVYDLFPSILCSSFLYLVYFRFKCTCLENWPLHLTA